MAVAVLTSRQVSVAATDRKRFEVDRVTRHSSTLPRRCFEATARVHHELDLLTPGRLRGSANDQDEGRGSPSRSETPPADRGHMVAIAASIPEQIGSLRVLVVDDIAMNRDIAGAFLRASGHQVAEAEGGAEAVDAVEREMFDVILMDVRMPEVDGMEATRRIRALGGARARIPIVALTAHAFADQVEQCRAAGMDGHLPKPFSPDTLLATVLLAFRTGRPEARDETPAPSMQSADDAAPPVLDRLALDRLVELLPGDLLAVQLASLTERGRALLDELNERNSDRGDLAASAHTLAGSAGLFGFARLSEVTRRLERAIRSGSGETDRLVSECRQVTTSTLAKIGEVRRTLAPVGTDGAA